MPGGSHTDSEGAPSPRTGLWHRLLLALPRVGSAGGRPPLGERLRSAVLKPVEPGADGSPPSDAPLSVAELETELKSANDKERLVGLLAAPIAAIIALTVVSALISKDPTNQYLANGQVNKNYVSLSLYHTLTLVLLGLAVVMLASAWYRKRLFLGIAMALYGLAVFNLHWWGFGIPFIMGAAWLLVRTFRLQRQLREATTGGTPGGRGRAGAGGARPRPNKRYTPPTPPPKRPLPPGKAKDGHDKDGHDKEQRAG
ncbi:MAG: hypothetical protein ABSG81_14100 [Acidimicrobiales bacterium]|jgi:uncharacterized membrane protein YgdD (TMEM256/DUF423 family)